MSHKNNEVLLERAAELIEETEGHPSGYDKALLRALNSNDLESVRYWVTRIEHELSIEYFATHDLRVV